MTDNNLNIDATPTDKMTKDLNLLKNVSDVSGMTKEEREKAEQLVSRVTESILSGKMTPQQTEQSSEVLKNLAAKGLEIAKESMAKVNEKEKQNNAVSQHLKEEVSKRAGYDGPVRDGKAVSADIQQQKNLQQNNLPDGKRQKDTQQTLKKNVLTQSETR